MRDQRMGLLVRIFCAMLAVLYMHSLCFAADNGAVRLYNRILPGPTDQQTRLHNSKFMPIEDAGAGTSCTAFRPPRLVAAGRSDLDSVSTPVVLDVVVGREGRIESFLILEGGSVPGRPLENLVRRRVYEPALCNGLPIEAEGRIEIPGR